MGRIRKRYSPAFTAKVTREGITELFRDRKGKQMKEKSLLTEELYGEIA